MFKSRKGTYIFIHLFCFVCFSAIIAISFNYKVAYGKNIHPIDNNTSTLLNKIYVRRHKILSHSFKFLHEEKLTFKITYLNLINAGEATLQTYPGKYESKKVCVIKAVASSAGWLRFFYYVHDETFSYFSLDKYYPYFLIMKRNEGQHHDFTEESLNGDYNKLIKSSKYKTAWKDLKNKEYMKKLKIEYNAPALYKNKIGSKWKPYIAFKNTQDVLSALYYLRMLNLKSNKDYYIPVYENTKRYIVLIKTGKYYNINTPAGKFNTIEVKAYLNFNGVFVHKGSLKIYLTTGANHIPVYLVTKIPIGYMTAILIKKKG